MIDKALLRKHADLVKEGMQKRACEVDIDYILQLDREWVSKKRVLETLRHERKKISQSNRLLCEERRGDKSPKGISEARAIAKKIKELEEETREIEGKLSAKLMMIPNIPDSTVPIGYDEKDNKVVRHWGEIREGFQCIPHEKIGEKLGIIDLSRASKISGARFGLYMGLGALMQKALINFMVDTHIKEGGYTFVWPPFLVLRESMLTTGQLPKFEYDLFRTDGNEMYLVPTAEVPLTNIHRGEIIPEAELPLKYVAYSPCFRREAGSYGKDTKGIIRQHQFEKVELVKFSTPESSFKELSSMVEDAERILKDLSLPYRVVELCTGDLGFSSAKTFDIEVWFPSQQKYREVSSCSNCTDFQARRGKIRLRRKNGSKVEYLHTLNGSGVAVGRVLAAILENYQTKDGCVIIPDRLKPYMNGVEKISKK